MSDDATRPREGTGLVEDARMIMEPAARLLGEPAELRRSLDDLYARLMDEEDEANLAADMHLGLLTTVEDLEQRLGIEVIE